MSKFWHILGSIGIAAVSVAIPEVRAVLLNHHIISTVLGTTWAVLGNLLPSPVLPKP